MRTACCLLYFLVSGLSNGAAAISIQNQGRAIGSGEGVLIEPEIGQQVADLKIPHIGTDTVTVTWRSPDDPKGEIKSYYILATNLETHNAMQTETTSTETTFTNLTPDTYYGISVRTENKQLNGRGGGHGYAVSKQIKTLPLVSIQDQGRAIGSEEGVLGTVEDVLIEPEIGQQVADLKIPRIGTDTVTVTWRSPDDPKGEIKSYYILATNLETHNAMQTETTSTETTFTNLTPDTYYGISVRTENKQLNGHGGGLGYAVTKQIKTLPLGASASSDTDTEQ